MSETRIPRVKRNTRDTTVSLLEEGSRWDLSGTDRDFHISPDTQTRWTRGKVGRANFPSSRVHSGTFRKARLTKEKSVLRNSWLSPKISPITWSIIYITRYQRPLNCSGVQVIARSRNYRGAAASERASERASLEASSTEYCSDERGRRINLPLPLVRRSLKKKAAR